MFKSNLNFSKIEFSSRFITLLLFWIYFFDILNVFLPLTRSSYETISPFYIISRKGSSPFVISASKGLIALSIYTGECTFSILRSF